MFGGAIASMVMLNALCAPFALTQAAWLAFARNTAVDVGKNFYRHPLNSSAAQPSRLPVWPGALANHKPH